MPRVAMHPRVEQVQVGLRMPLVTWQLAKAKSDRQGITLSCYIRKVITNDLRPNTFE